MYTKFKSFNRYSCKSKCVHMSELCWQP